MGEGPSSELLVNAKHFSQLDEPKTAETKGLMFSGIGKSFSSKVRSKFDPNYGSDMKKDLGVTDFFERALVLISIYLVQGVFVEDVVSRANSRDIQLSWFFSFLTIAGQVIVALWFLKENEANYISKNANANNGEYWRKAGIFFTRRFSWILRMRWEYSFSSFCILSYQVLTNQALIFLPYNTAQLAKSAKIVFVMIFSVLLLKKPFPLRSWIYAVVMVAGLCMLSLADNRSHKSKIDNSVDVSTGLLFMSLSIVFMALNNVLQEGFMSGKHFSLFLCFRRSNNVAAESADEVLLLCNFTSLIVLLVGTLYSGELLSGIQFFLTEPVSVTCRQTIVLIVNGLGQRLMFQLMYFYGASSATIVITFRKTLTFILSVILFPKPFTQYHLAALCTIVSSAALLQLCNMKTSGTFEPGTASNSSLKKSFVRFFLGSQQGNMKNSIEVSPSTVVAREKERIFDTV